MRQYIDVHEVSARTGCSPYWVRELARRGQLPCVRRGPGCRVLFDPAAVEKALGAAPGNAPADRPAELVS